jgi:uncharacterized protein (DUF433 family)
LKNISPFVSFGKFFEFSQFIDKIFIINIPRKKELGRRIVMTKPFNRITVNPEVCMGQPTIRGMRITVAFVLKLLASGMTHEEILQAYPELEEEDILQTIERKYRIKKLL